MTDAAEVAALARIGAERRARRAGQTAPPGGVEGRFTCVHRGAAAGTARCSEGCGERVPVPLFACARHGTCSVLRATEGGAAVCSRCPDRAPLAGRPDGFKAEAGAVHARHAAATAATPTPAPPAPLATEWAVGLTCVPERLHTTLPGTLASLDAAGFPPARLFVDGIQTPEWDALPHAKTFRGERLKTFGNWLLGAWELLIRHPHAGRFLMVQDDVVFARNVRPYLDATAWPDKAYLNLFAHPSQSVRPDRGFAPTGQHTGWGALALAFPRASLEAVVSSHRLPNKPKEAGRRSWVSIDGTILHAAKAAGLREFVHGPGLCDHTGEVSSMGNGGKGGRRSPAFPGPAFDALTLLAATPRTTPGGGMPAHQRERVLAEIVTRRIAADMVGRRPLRVLVFGAGSDTAGIVQANKGGRTVVLEDQPAWLAVGREAGAECHAVTYATRVRDGVRPDAPALEVPASVTAERFDVILIDGPNGGGPDSPGRQQACALAARLAAPGGVILAHDADRPHDAACLAHHLGRPAEVVAGPPDLAVYRTPPVR